MEQSALEMIEAHARSDAQHAQDVRAAHRRRTAKGSYTREEDIRLALKRLKSSMRPIRVELARLPYAIARTPRLGVREQLISQQLRLRSVSADVQRERRKLWKMQERKEAKRVKRGARR